MDFSDIINDIATYLQNNIYVTLGLLLVSLLLLVKKTRLFIAVLLITVLILGILYYVSDVTETGETHRRDTEGANVLKD